MTSPTVPAPPLSERGHVGFGTMGGGWWDAGAHEKVPQLRWPESVETYDDMRRGDAQVKSVLRAVALPILRSTWQLDPAGCRPEVAERVADDLGLSVLGVAPVRRLRSRDRFSWSEHLRLALTMHVFGFSVFEQVYRLDADRTPRLRKLAWRPPRTISRFDVAPDGGLVAVEQFSGAATPTRLPVERLVVYSHEREGGDWTGQSLLRPAWKHQTIKDRLIRIDAETIRRNGMGVPRYTGAAGETDLSAGLAIARQWASGADAGGAVPHGAEIDLVGVTGAVRDALPSIRYHDEQIARSVLAHVLNLGTQTGSWALGDTLATIFVDSLQGEAQAIADTAQQHIIEDIVDLTFGPTEPAPQLVFEEIGSRQAATAQALKLLVDAGILYPDRATEEAARQSYGLPAKQTTGPGAGE